MDGRASLKPGNICCGDAARVGEAILVPAVQADESGAKFQLDRCQRVGSAAPALEKPTWPSPLPAPLSAMVPAAASSMSSIWSTSYRGHLPEIQGIPSDRKPHRAKWGNQYAEKETNKQHNPDCRAYKVARGFSHLSVEFPTMLRTRQIFVACKKQSACCQNTYDESHRLPTP
jgi:hypothetical protein